MQKCLVLLGLAASVPVLLLQEWQTQPVQPDVTFQEFMREAQDAGQEFWIKAFAKVSQSQHTTTGVQHVPQTCATRLLGFHHVCAESC